MKISRWPPEMHQGFDDDGLVGGGEPLRGVERPDGAFRDAQSGQFLMAKLLQIRGGFVTQGKAHAASPKK
jgi:hypothetical protein